MVVVRSTEGQQGYDYAPPPPEVQLQPQGGGASKPQASGGHGHGGSGDPLDWLRESVPGRREGVAGGGDRGALSEYSEQLGDTGSDHVAGEPGVDYPIFAAPPDTGFSCLDKEGLYADPGSDCQAWHVCLAPDRQWSFLCPNGTIFNQEIFTCVWWFDFDCGAAESLYSLNEDLYSEQPSTASQSQSQARPAAAPGPGSRGQAGGSKRRPSGGSVAAEAGLVLVIPGLEEEEELPGYRADSLYGGPGSRQRRHRRVKN